MPQTNTISTQNPLNPALDYNELRKLGIAYIEKTASAIWTDYNVHDPGITTLEYLCYALTDLSYRSGFSIPDLLATETDTIKNIKEHFLSAKKIFPNKAVTVIDYRKLLIDIVGVKNAWLTRQTKTLFADLVQKKLSYNQPNSRRWERVVVQGYHSVLLEFDVANQEGKALSAEEKETLKQKARTILQANRNMCQDFTSIDEVKQEEFRLCAEIELAPGANPIATMAKMFFNIQQHLTPLVKFYSLAQLMNEGHTADKIFEGPLLEHGFIKDEELNASELRKEIHLSDIMREIMAVEGIINILDVRFNSVLEKKKEIIQKTKMLKKLDFMEDSHWVIDVTDGLQPLISILKSKLVLYKDGMPFRPDLERVNLEYSKLIDEYLGNNEQVRTDDISYNTGAWRNVGSPYSIQHHFPKTYGISHWGLPDDAPATRKIQAKQLQGYLYFFDQLLANSLGQLANIRSLLSAGEEEADAPLQITNTYFTQLANDFLNAGELFSLTPESMATAIQTAAESDELFVHRRNLFLDHLLSRYAESFSDYVDILDTAFPGLNKHQLIKTKQNFLRNYPQYSSQRLAAFNYEGPQVWDTENISGLEKRLQRLLGINNISRRKLVNIFSVIKSDTSSGTEQFTFELVDNRLGKAIAVSTATSPSAESAQRQLALLYDLAANLARYSINPSSDGMALIIQIKDSAGIAVANSTAQYPTNEEALAGLEALHNKIMRNQSEEGLFLIEHLLLLQEMPLPGSPIDPMVEERGLIPICADENCEDCYSNDPYTFRISMVLPAYAERFLNIDFRKYVERIIRMETPAHIYPKICWVNNEQLQEFEAAYQDWLNVEAGISADPENLILGRFINILTTLKSVYPRARLQDCSSTEERRLFLLNQNALGTIKS